MKYITIKSTRSEGVDTGFNSLSSYLFRNCKSCFTRKDIIYVPLEELETALKTKFSLRIKSFLTHTPSFEVVIKTRNINLDKLTTLQFAEIIFGGEAK